MAQRSSTVASGAVDRWVRGRLDVETRGQACHDVTAAIDDWLAQVDAADGLLVAASLHTTASLMVQENADPDVQRDLVDALARLAPSDARYRHGLEGPDDMPGHIKAVLTGQSAALVVADGRLLLGQWQAVYLLEHRDAPKNQTISMYYIGS